MRINLPVWNFPIPKSVCSNQWIPKISFLFILFFSFNLNLHAQHDLSLTKTVSVDSAGVGDTVTFIITVNNDGGTDLTGVTVKDLLPANMTYISNTLGGHYTPGTGIWIINGVGDSTIAAATPTVELQIKARLESSGVLFNEAEVYSMNGFDVDSEPNDGEVNDDDYAAACVSVPLKICTTLSDTIVLTAPDGYIDYKWFKDMVEVATTQTYKATVAGSYTFTAEEYSCPFTSCCPTVIEEACFDLALDKKLASGQPENVSPGDDVTYTITIHNQGDFYADSILITDYLPAGFTNNSGAWVGNDTLLTIADGGLPTGGLAPMGTKSVDIILTVGMSVSADSLVNYAEISSAKDVSKTDSRDIDSTPDATDGNDGGGNSNSAADDYILGDGTSMSADGVAATDEDDHDPEVIYICPTITNPLADFSICTGTTADSLTVETTNTDANGISFVYFTSAQSGSDMYTGGTGLGMATASASIAKITNVSFPANMTGSPVTYYVYAILNPTPSAASCRPFQEIEVTVQPNATGTESYDGCAGDGYSVVVGSTTYNEGNTSGTETLTAANGCDSVVTVSLVFKPNATGTESYDGCAGDGYSVVVGSTTYNEGNTSGTETLTAANGCDSVVTVSLVFKPNATGTESYDGCEGDGYSVVVGSTTYNEGNASGTETLTAANGCDSVITVSLVYKAGATSTVSYDGCAGDGHEETVNGTTYNEASPSGTETVIGGAANGCDSVITVSLVYKAAPTITLTVSDTTICNGNSVNIVINNTQVGVDYQLRDDSNDGNIGMPMAGNGGDITFILSPTDTTTYNILATNATSGCFAELTDKAVIIVVECDFGDLPDATADTLAGDYQTVRANGGPLHYIIPGLILGGSVDGEADGQQSGMANGDDTNVDDEEGVTFFNSLNIVPGGIVRLPISVINTTGSTAHLEAWIDWNADGKFSGPSEMIIDIDDSGSPFPGFVTVNVPTTIADMTPLGVRFRLSLVDNMTPYGKIESGEVEDYLISIDCATGVCLPISSIIIRE